MTHEEVRVTGDSKRPRDGSLLRRWPSKLGEAPTLALASGRSPFLGQAEAGLPMAAFAEVEEPADDPMGLLEQHFQAGAHLLVAVLEAAVHGPELGDGRGVQEPVVRQPSQQGLEFLCGQGHRAELREAYAHPLGGAGGCPQPFRGTTHRRRLHIHSRGPFIYLFFNSLLRNN